MNREFCATVFWSNTGVNQVRIVFLEFQTMCIESAAKGTVVE